MKKQLLILSIVLFSVKVFSQGSIQGVTIDPANPTTADYVKVYVDAMFSSGGCAVDNSGVFTNANASFAHAHHCLGMLTFICNATDTFNLGYLPAGMNSFFMTLTSGLGGPGCSPGFAPDDTSTTYFNVSLATGIDKFITANSSISINPNPMNSTSEFRISSVAAPVNAQLSIMDICGKEVRKITGINESTVKLDRDNLSSGLYFYKFTEADKPTFTGKFIVE